jgi:hypothetical protein
MSKRSGIILRDEQEHQMSTRRSYQFKISRRQRWRTVTSQGWISHALTTGILLIAAILSVRVSLWLTALLLIAAFFPIRPFISGVVYLLGPGNLHLEFGARGLGFGSIRADWWIPLDEISSVEDNPWGTTSIRHYAGTCIEFPTGALSEDDASLLWDAAASFHSRKS